MKAGETVWSYAESKDAERWSGSCATREEAIREAFVEVPEAEEMWVVECCVPDPARFMPDARDIIEIMSERAYDEAGEAAEEWPDVSEAEAKELEAFLDAWAARVAPMNFWIVDGKPERVSRVEHAPTDPAPVSP